MYSTNSSSEKPLRREFFNGVFFTFSLFGLPIIFAPLLLYLLKFEPSLAIRAAFTIATTEVTCGIIKLLYKKERPVPVPAKNLYQLYNARGFPSIHTARITAFSGILAYLYGNKLLNIVSTLLIIAVAYSRIHLKKHDAIDVIGGFAIGTIISALWLLI